MPLNRSTLKTRTLTAAIFVIVMLGGLLWNHWSFFILFSIVHFGCWYEYQKLIGKISTDYAQISSFHKYGVMIAGWCMMLYFTNDEYRLLGIGLHAIGWWLGLIFVFILPIIELLFARQVQLKNIWFSAAGLVYISLPLGLMIALRNIGFGELLGYHVDYGWIIPMVLIGAIWINDTMAYIVGSLIGNTPFSKISPKKTWEGTLGGAILAIVVVTIAMKLIYPGQSFWQWPVIAAIAAVIGTAGDLFESKLKRLANVKDSGQIMPGHGGFLDRFDSLLFAIPFVWLYISLIA